MKLIDIGCGPKKAEDHYGIDCFQFHGVDQVFDFDAGKWPIEDNSFDGARSVHVIEHITDTKNFLSEIHRICKNGAEVYIETPHFSWVDSWSDPTHRWHFSAGWYRPLAKGEYLSAITGEFEHVKTVIEFNKSARSLFPRLIVKLFGIETYERYYAFKHPARNIHTWLRVKK
ncbi:MAG TPA: methyltransferase domain-containing protein [Bdellovibrio sp.]|uniref:class I SAM-dependent methyltransferase n=1 Tax=Bdellovibrio sp. TaxID=28201 RepID=UPI002F05EB7F